MTCHYLNEPGNVCNKCGEIHSGTDRTYKRFRVYVAQINAAVIEVEARDEEEARAMGASKWRSDYAIPRVKAAEEVAPASAASPVA